MPTYTHKQLVNAARKWLTRRHPVVVTELACGSENADALGFYGNGATTLVECKASVADFRADSKKFFRANPEMGMGTERYYLTPVGLINESDLPEGWGLLVWDGRRVRAIKDSTYFEHRSHEREARTLISLIRRIGKPDMYGCAIRCYQYDVYEQSKNRATLGIQRMEAGRGEPRSYPTR